MSLLSKFKTDDSIQGEVDSLGGRIILDSAIYATKVAMAYVMTSPGGATGVNLTLKTQDGKEVKETLWISSGNEKGNLNYYVNKKTGEKRYLPGFLIFQSLCLLGIGKEVAEVETEDKLVNVFDQEQKKEVPTKVPVIVELLDAEIYAGIIKQIVDKNEKVNDEYVPTGETREENTIDKLFRAADKMTTAEIIAGATEPNFFNAWTEKNTGQVRDRSTKNPTPKGTPNAAVAAATSKPNKSLFAAAN